MDGDITGKHKVKQTFQIQPPKTYLPAYSAEKVTILVEVVNLTMFVDVNDNIVPFVQVVNWTPASHYLKIVINGL